MKKHKINNTCPNSKCKAIDSYEEVDVIFVGKQIQCKKCKNKFDPDTFYERKYDIDNIVPSNPTCPNTKCNFHKNPPPAIYGFVISVVSEGFLGKIFKSEAYGIVSCKLCGEVIGVGGKG